jgi:hypothetical protein
MPGKKSKGSFRKEEKVSFAPDSSETETYTLCVTLIEFLEGYLLTTDHKPEKAPPLAGEGWGEG